MKQLTAKLVDCPHCGQKIGFLQHIEKCAFCGKLLCTKCIESSKFCSECARRIPSEFRQKFRWLTPVVPLLLVFAACVVIGRAFYAFGGWQPANLGGTLVDLGVTMLYWLVGFLLILIAAKLPHAGTWLFYYWIAQPANRAKVEAAMADEETGQYVPQSALYRAKLAGIAAYQKWGNKAVILGGVIGNILTFIFWVIRSVVPIPDVSQFAGVVWAVGYVLSIAMVGVAAGFYLKKEVLTEKSRQIMEILSWGYLLILPLTALVFIFRLVVILGVLPQFNSPEWLPIFTSGYTAFLAVQTTIVVLLGWQMLRVTPVWQMPTTYERKDVKWSFRWFVRLCAKVILGGIAITLLVFNLLLLVGLDAPQLAMVLPVISYYLLPTIYVPIFIMLLKMLPWKPRRYRQVYWTAVKAFVIVVGISLVPILSIPWTNNNNDVQFAAVFGPNWEAQVLAKATPEQQAFMRKYQFSLFDAMFGFEVPAVNEIHNVPYMTDQKRYGNTSLTDTFRFDTYLPAGLNFGDGKPDMLPVIIMTHGSGMDRGWGNVWQISRYFASLGYLVCDMSYGKTGNGSQTNDNKGYDFTDGVRQLGNFTWMLQQNASYYHADLKNVYFSGRSLGGYYDLVCAYGYNKTYFAGMFADTMVVRGVMPFYPLSDIGIDSNALELVGMGPHDGPIINGSSNPLDADYNPQWNYYNPTWLARNSAPGALCPTLVLQGTHDMLIPNGFSRSFAKVVAGSGNTVILCSYLLQNHGFDALHWSPSTQSILYYYERFLILTH
ncbi:MAG TPA: hypothetical protein VKK79_01735 [Candidatus Lokiarchaeia archaeon]|nr:hypothetical protein [Candidatus Lokiarchaeia archaeon]